METSTIAMAVVDLQRVTEIFFRDLQRSTKSYRQLQRSAESRQRVKFKMKKLTVWQTLAAYNSQTWVRHRKIGLVRVYTRTSFALFV